MVNKDRSHYSTAHTVSADTYRRKMKVLKIKSRQT